MFPVGANLALSLKCNPRATLSTYCFVATSEAPDGLDARRTAEPDEKSKVPAEVLSFTSFDC